MGWYGKKNSELLSLIDSNGFDFFITIYKNLRYQQNLNKFKLTIFLLLAKNNRRETLQNLIKKIKDKIIKREYVKINEIS
jgi:hypothetical protein